MESSRFEEVYSLDMARKISKPTAYQRLNILRLGVRAGFAAVERGDYTDYDQSTIRELANRVKERGAKRLTEQRRHSTG